jgi:hypothetical protein
MAWSAAVYILTTASILLEGVAGDFRGWRHGLISMGTIAAMLVVHEVFLAVAGSGGEPAQAPFAHRFLERCFYIVLAAGAYSFNRYIDLSLSGV